MKSKAGADLDNCWCILRTSGRSTLPLAASLSEDGFEAWSPAEQRRHPRTRAKVTIPIMPTFVFARASHLVDLLGLAAMAVKPRRNWVNGYRRDRGRKLEPHGSFSVFHYFDRIPLLADHELRGLRRFEQLAQPRSTMPKYEPGEQVMVTEGVACGLGGQVVRSDGGFTLVCFGGHMRMKISTFILKPNDGIGSGQAFSGAAAQAA